MSYIGKQPTKAPLTASDIEDGIITAAKIEDGAVVAAEIASNAVTTAKINADAVTSAKIADNAVVTAAINADAVTGAKIADDAINSEHYTDGSIDTAHIADSNVTQAKIADQAINEAKLQISNAPTNGYMLTAQSGNTGGLTWAEAGGGKILQVVSVADTTIRSTTSSTFNTMSSAFTLNITPSATSSKILIMLSTGYYITTNDGALAIYRGSTNLGHSSYGHFYIHQNGAFGMATINYMDSPNTTSQVTYTIYGRKMSGGTLNINAETGEGSFILMEIGA